MVCFIITSMVGFNGPLMVTTHSESFMNEVNDIPNTIGKFTNYFQIGEQMNTNEMTQESFSPQHLELYQKSVEEYRKQYAGLILQYGAKYIAPPKDKELWNEDWLCYFQVSYRGYLVERTDGHTMLVKVDDQGNREVIEWLCGSVEDAFQTIDVMCK